MTTVFIGIILFVLGAMSGSFVGAQVWRLRARQLVEDKASGQKINNKELKRLQPLLSNTIWTDRSIDLDTGKRLQWFELLPIISWLFLKGRSRYSGKPIGAFELLIEIVMAALFVVSYIFWPFSLENPVEIIKFICWLLIVVMMAIQFMTDLKWQVLWTHISFGTIIIGIVIAIITILQSSDWSAALWSVIGSLLILGGLYFVIYAVSHETWVGLGDVFLAIALGLILADWKFALIALFLANLLGSIVVLIGMAMHKITRRQHVPFGPFLISALVLTVLFGNVIVEFYSTLIIG